MTEPRIQTVIALIDHDSREGLTLDELSRIVNISASRLRHLFKEETGVSLQQYLKAKRMLKAKDLLETTFLNVQEVMLLAGINDESHFVRDFSKLYGLPPMRFRNWHLKEVNEIPKAATIPVNKQPSAPIDSLFRQ